MSHSYWRQKASPIIEKILLETRGKTESEITKALHDAYPFGHRSQHPYKIWLDEIRRQRFGRQPAIDVGGMKKLAEWEAIYGRRES
jgi:hypothetical protein